MRVIEQARLAFREGTSDKVYEVDLVEVANGQYVVNFRYGRRGSALRDGTKTATPVPLAKARQIFEKLVAEKTAGGYRPIGAPTAEASLASRADDDDGDDGDSAASPSVRDAALIDRLRRGHRGEDPIGPAVWKAGDRDLRAAEPALLELLPSKAAQGIGQHAWQHTVLSALARCGTTASLPALTDIANSAHYPPHVRDVAKLAITRIDPARAEPLGRQVFPAPVMNAYNARDAAALARAAEQLLVENPTAARGVAVGLYLIDDALTRPAMLAMARTARLSNPEAATVRALYRLAEIKRDAELFALLARRIDAHQGWRPFGPRTRQYFRRRVARVLRRLGRAQSPDYVRMASALLLSYTDADGEAVRRGYGRTWDRFAKHHALNDMLYGGDESPRYARGHATRSVWHFQSSWRIDAPAPLVREERFPALWDRAPDVVWTMVRGSGATPVVEFACRALRDNKPWVAQLADEDLAAVLGGGHPIAQQFAYDMAKDRPMSAALARGALESQVDKAHVWVMMWIASHPDDIARDAEMLALLVTGKTDAIRDAARSLLRGRAVDDAVARNVAVRAIATLIALAPDSPNAAERARGAAEILLASFEAPLRQISGDVLRDMIKHPLAALGELAGELMIRHPRREELPHDLLELLLGSQHPSVRALGGRLLAMTPAEIAKDDLEALVLFATSANKELRDATRALIAEVARKYPDVGRTLADRLVDTLLRQQFEGVPSHVVQLLRHELAQTLPKKPAATILKLCGAFSPHAREAGGLLLAQVEADEVGLDDIARLASHEVKSIREGAWTLARASVPRYRMAPVAVSRLVDSAWQDTRDFAIAFIRDALADRLSPDAIIAICDSVRPEVQALGKQLLHDRFSEADAGRYLVRLAEHPSTNLQLLVSGLLEHHVAGDLERLRAIAPYLVTILSQVNRGRVAKQRVMRLIAREATRSPAAAALLAPILDRQSATIAITQKHPLIATMVDVRHTYPDVPLPITIVQPGGK